MPEEAFRCAPIRTRPALSLCVPTSNAFHVGDVRASSLALLRCLEELETRVRSLVAARRANDDNPDDRFRGLYLAEADVERVAARRRDEQAAPWGPAMESAGAASARLVEVARRLGLDDLDVGILLVALAPDLDRRFEQFYGYLQDDVTRRRAGIDLAVELCGAAGADVSVRERFTPQARLIREGLLLVEEPDRPFLTRSLRVPDGVCNYLVGSDAIDNALTPFLAAMEPHPSPEVDMIARSMKAGSLLWYLREQPGASGYSIAAAAFSAIGSRPLAIDLRKADPGDDLAALAAIAIREARLRDVPLVVGPVEIVTSSVDAIRAIADSSGPVALVGTAAWDPSWSTRTPLQLSASPAPHEDRLRLWRSGLDGRTEDLDPVTATAHFKLAPDQIQRAAAVAAQAAAAENRRVEVADLLHGARSQAAIGLERLARRVEPSFGWADLVLPDDAIGALREISARVRHKERVLKEWSMRRGEGRDEGVAALFAGQSGTGKTMAAEVIAGDLGLHLYTVDLATVVDKYIGETEKNLERIFGEAEAASAVLFFDEADALFGKRSDVKDAHDRYANVETAYLLQRMEAFDGIVVLATNLRANLDEAFTRRLDKIVTFPMPGPDERARLWRRCFRPPLPLDGDVDLDFCARAFELSGGSIRNIALGAAYRAADSSGAVTMRDVIVATEDEYHKMGRLCRAEEFGPYFDLVSP
jgi:hypothetical protein